MRVYVFVRVCVVWGCGHVCMRVCACVCVCVSQDWGLADQLLREAYRVFQYALELNPNDTRALGKAPRPFLSPHTPHPSNSAGVATAM